jgi:sugar transferase (PEP-CTERM/EpsH1 system associated)
VNLLWLKSELLHPIDKGGRIRTYHMLRELKREHRITYLTLDDGDAASDAADRAEEYSHELIRIPLRTQPKRSAGFYLELLRNLMSRLPYAVWKYRSTAMRRVIAEAARKSQADVIVCDFLAPAVNIPARQDLSCPVMLFQHNVEATIWERHARVASNPLAKVYLREQWRRMRAFERAQCRRFDHVVAVSRRDMEVFESEYGITKVSEIPTGVDIEYFRPEGGIQPQRCDLVFTGSMDWLPNEDAIVFFTKSILPGIRAVVPDVTLTVVGRNPSPRILDLARHDPAVRITGSVPDVRPFIEHATVFIVPLRIGGGTRLKIYEAMAMEKAIVSTSIGAEGLPVTDGEDIILADTPETFASSVIQLLTDAQRAERIGRRAANLVRAEFGWGRVADKFATICDGLVAPRHESVPAWNSR